MLNSAIFHCLVALAHILSTWWNSSSWKLLLASHWCKQPCLLSSFVLVASHLGASFPIGWGMMKHWIASWKLLAACNY